jgi:hypothetical protein
MSTETRATTVNRGEILKRLAVTLVCLIFFEVLTLIVEVATLFQYAYLLAAKKRSEPLRRFCNGLAQYGYRIMRYATLNENRRPFPFAEFPSDEDCEPPAKQVQFR